MKQLVLTLKQLNLVSFTNKYKTIQEVLTLLFFWGGAGVFYLPPPYANSIDICLRLSPILILPTSSADASADESAANFLKIWCFSHFFLTFLNFLESFGYSSAPACFLTPDSSVISFKSTRKAKVWSWADRPMTKSLAGLTTHKQRHVKPSAHCLTDGQTHTTVEVNQARNSLVV